MIGIPSGLGPKTECEHEFARHVGVKVFNKTGMAWVQLSMVVGNEELPEMWLCVHCGEQGYEVR